MKAKRIALALTVTSAMFAIACSDRKEPRSALPPATPVSAPEPPTIAQTLQRLGLESFSVDDHTVTWEDGNPALNTSPNQQVLLAPVTMVRTHLAEEQLVSIGTFNRSKVLLRYEIIGARPTVDLNAYANSAEHKPEAEYVDIYALVYWGELADGSPGLELVVETQRNDMVAAGIEEPKINKITVESRRYHVIALGEPKRSTGEGRSKIIYGTDGWEISETKTLGQVEFGGYRIHHIDKTQLEDVVRLSQ